MHCDPSQFQGAYTRRMAQSGDLTPYVQTIAAVGAGRLVSIDALDAMQAALRAPRDEPSGAEATARERAVEDILRALVELDTEEAAFANSLGLILQERQDFVEAAGLFLQAARRTEARAPGLTEDDQGWIAAWRRNASVCLSEADLPLSAAVVAQAIGDIDYAEEARTALRAALGRLPGAKPGDA